MAAVTFFSVLLISLNAFAFKGPFKPALAAEQETITGQMIADELNQFETLGKWMSVNKQIVEAKIRSNKLRLEYDRMKSLDSSRNTTKYKFLKLEQKFKDSELELERLKNAKKKFAALAETYKFKIMCTGNKSKDFRYEMALKTREYYKAQATELDLEFQKAQNRFNYAKYLHDSGEKLLKKNIINRQEYENREMAFQEVSAQMERMKSLRDSVKIAIAGIDQTIEDRHPSKMASQ